MPFNQKKFLKSIEGADTTTSSSDDDNDDDGHQNKTVFNSQLQQTRRRQRSQGKKPKQLSVTKRKSYASSSSSDDSSSSSSFLEANNNNTTPINPRLVLIQKKYSMVEWRAGTIFDCYSENFYHFTQFFNNCLGPRIASAAQKDRTKRPPYTLIRRSCQLLHDHSVSATNSKLPVRFSCRSSGDEVEFPNLKSRGCYLFEAEQSQDLIDRAAKMLESNTSSSTTVIATSFQNLKRNSSSREFWSPTEQQQYESKSFPSTKKLLDDSSAASLVDKDVHNNVGVDPSSLVIHRLLPHNFSVKTNLRLHSLDFPTTAGAILPASSVVPPWWISAESDDDIEQDKTLFELGSKHHHHKELIEKRGPQCFSVATVFWEAPPVLIEKSHQKRVFSISGGRVVINKTFSSSMDDDEQSNSSFFPPEIGSVFLSASLPDELLILNSRWEANRSYQLYKIPSSLHSTSQRGSVQGQCSEFRRAFRDGIVEPLHQFSVSNCLYLVGRRTIKSTKRTQQQQNNQNHQNVFRTASDIMCVAPGSLNVEHDAGLFVGLRDGTCALYDSQISSRQFHVFGKVDNDPIVSIGVCDLLSSSFSENSHIVALHHVYTVTASQRVILWDLNGAANKKHQLKILETEEETGRASSHCDATSALSRNPCFLMVLNEGQHEVNEFGKSESAAVSNLGGGNGSVLSGVSRFSFVPGQRCYFEYDFHNDAVYLKRISRSLTTSASGCQWFVETVARWEQLSSGSANSTEEQESDLVILLSTHEEATSKIDVNDSNANHNNYVQHQRQQQQLQQTTQDYRKRQKFSMFNPQPFYGSVTAGVDFETKRPCCFIVDEVHQFAAAVMY